MEMKRIAVFASGNGSNFQAIVNAVKRSELNASITLLVSDKPGAYVIDRAMKEEIPTFVFAAKNYQEKADYEREILKHLKTNKIDLIVLAGYMRLVGGTLLQAFAGKIINIHPSLLPAFPGKDAIGQALEAGVSQTGITIHYVDAGMDTGPNYSARGNYFNRRRNKGKHSGENPSIGAPTISKGNPALAL